ncbi:MAG TPA: copper chaperone PCu(A)C [Streptosporangiaceae bacterium]|nr:copper chaperone PCu(A)C [Streptosporangiaceae bacterium]
MRRLTSVASIASAVAVAAIALTGCASSTPIAVTSAYVPQPTTPGTTVAYLDIRNNGHADRLVAARTSVGGTVQLRARVQSRTGALIMRAVPGIPIPADSLTRLNPDNYQLLITGAGPMHDGKDVWLYLTFADAGTVTVLAQVTNPQTGGSSYFLN